jgi:microcystin-dependent protein
MKNSIYALLFALAGMCQAVSAQDAYIGEIRLFAGNFAPRGWAFCEGQMLSIAQNTALFSILGTTYGGDGRTTFTLPDLRGRVPLHPGQGPGLSSYSLGESGGVQSINLQQNQLPLIAPSLKASNELANTDDPTNAILAKPNPNKKLMIYRTGSTPNVALNPASAGTIGGGQPIDNRQPYLGLNYIICLQGIYPSRN